MLAQEYANAKVFLDLDKLFESNCCSAGTEKGLWLYGSTMIYMDSLMFYHWRSNCLWAESIWWLFCRWCGSFDFIRQWLPASTESSMRISTSESKAIVLSQSAVNGVIRCVENAELVSEGSWGSSAGRSLAARSFFLAAGWLSKSVHY